MQSMATGYVVAAGGAGRLKRWEAMAHPIQHVAALPATNCTQTIRLRNLRRLETPPPAVSSTPSATVFACMSGRCRARPIWSSRGCAGRFRQRLLLAPAHLRTVPHPGDAAGILGSED